jgi:hypothetical protein
MVRLDRVHGAQLGLYVEFESPPGIELKLESLENRRRQMRGDTRRQGVRGGAALPRLTPQLGLAPIAEDARVEGDK